MRVIIDGRSAAGESTFADALAESIDRSERVAVRASIDDFHRPGHKTRSIRREWTPQSYCDEGFDYLGFRDLVLQPLGPGGSLQIRPKLFNSFHDRPYQETWQTVDSDAIAVIDGTFFLRPELVDYWDQMIWLEIDFETMVSRAVKRDVAWVGSATEVEARYRQHWIPTHALHEQRTHPRNRADIVIDNTNVDSPQIMRLR